MTSRYLIYFLFLVQYFIFSNHYFFYRLDRLFILLETGGSSVTRKAAANQLGQVVRLHPHELEPLLERISGYLRSSTWETRIAASQAIEAVIKQIPQWCPSGLPPIKLGVLDNFFVFKIFMYL